MSKTKNIFMAVLGISPAIITEALYYYTTILQKNIKFDDIVIFTTSKGRDIICEKLFDQGILAKMEKDLSLTENYFNFSEDNIIVYKNEFNEEINDIRTENESLIAVDTIFNIMKKYTQNNNSKIIATIAGGRKTMGSMMSTSFQMLAREQDELIHIMAMIKICLMINGTIQEMKSKTEKLDISLLPVLKIGQFLPITIEKDSYQETLEKMQNYISDFTPINELIIDKGEFISNAESFKLSPVRASLLRYLIEKRLNSKNVKTNVRVVLNALYQ